MLNLITRESLEILLEEIIDAVDETSNRDLQFEFVEQILIANGIIEIVED